jgi:hypothetical protein
MGKHLLTVLFLLFIVSISALEVEACTCGYVTPDSYSVDAVFIGTITKQSGATFATKYNVQVSEVFRGLENQQKVEILHKNLDCGSTMYENNEYLFLASRDKSNGQLFLGPCNYSYKNSGQQKQMIEILRWKKNKNNQTGLLVGKVWIYDYEKRIVRKPNGVDKVYAEDSKGNRFETEIELDGFYKFSNLAEGIYKVFIELPKQLTTLADLKDYDDEKSFRLSVKIAKNKGVIEDFDVIANGQISGRIFNNDGTPTSEANVHLLNSDGLIDESTETDKTGFYKFDGIQVGKFKLMVGVTWNNYVSPFWKEAYFPTTYFPNVISRNNSIPIELSEGQIIENQNITLLPKYKRTRLKGKVLMPGGTPAKHVGISIQIQVKESDRTLHSAWEELAKTDFDGRFSLEVYENTNYLLKIEFERKKLSYFADCFSFTSENKPRQLTIKLQKGKGSCDEKNFGF